MLHLYNYKNEDIKQFYHLGKELGQGAYGLVKISTRNCHALNKNYIQKSIMKKLENSDEQDIG